MFAYEVCVIAVLVIQVSTAQLQMMLRRMHDVPRQRLLPKDGVRVY